MRAVLELPYGIEGASALKQIVKEDGSVAEVGEQLDFKVTEFNKEDRKIQLSHVRTYNDTKEEVPAEEKKKNTKDSNKASSASTDTAEKSTLGDLDALTNLKAQMEDSAREEAKKKLDKKEKAAKVVAE
jgi:small subunit ribosomal protein S1